MASDKEASLDARVEGLWRILDTRKEGQLDLNGLRKGLRKMDHPLKNADHFLREVLEAVDTNGDGKIEYDEFRTFVETTETQLRGLFNSIDRDKDGKLDKDELSIAFSKAGLTVSRAKLDQFFAEIDTNHDGVISFDEWRNFLLFIPVDSPGLKAVLTYYSSTVLMNPEGDVAVSDETIEGLGKRFPTTFFDALRSIASPRSQPVKAKEPFAPLFQQSPQSERARDVAPVVIPQPWDPDAEHLPTLPPALIDWILLDLFEPILTSILPNPGYFLAGGIAGAISRTVTAPLDRLKVYLIAQTGAKTEAVKAAKEGAPAEAAKKAARPLIGAMKELWRAGGMRSLFAGNGLNVLKIMPESAIKFGSYEGAKRALARVEGHRDPQQIRPLSKFVAGGLGGMVSQLFVYPIDTLKFRMQCETVEGGLHGNKLLIATAKQMWSKGKLHTFYRGLPMGLVGMFPYAAIDLGTFEYLKRLITAHNARVRGCHEDDIHQSSVITAGIGAFSGALGASVVYPLNLLRTRLQTQGTTIHPPTYTGIIDVTRRTIQHEGFRGLFKGITPNLLKVAPAVSITYVVYENSKKLLGLK